MPWTRGSLLGEGGYGRVFECLNDDGRIYLTQTRVDGRFAIRVQVGSFDCRAEDVMLIAKTVEEMLA